MPNSGVFTYPVFGYVSLIIDNNRPRRYIMPGDLSSKKTSKGNA